MGREQVRRGVRVKGEMQEGDAPVNAFTVDQRRMVMEYCWAGVWGREGLTRKERSLVTLGMLAGLNSPSHHIRAQLKIALKNGCTADNLRELCLHATVYCGISTAAEVTRLAQEVLEEAGHTFAPVALDGE